MIIDYNAPFIAREIPLTLSYYGNLCYFTEHNSQTAGSSCSIGISSKISALGEYLEREFMYNDIVSEGTFSSAELSQEEQLLIPFDNEFESLEYITAKNFFSDKTIRIPRSLVSLDSSRDTIQHFRDSSGGALGKSINHSRLSAFLEFIERQSMILSWQTQCYSGYLSNEQTLALCNRHHRDLFSRFLYSGKIKLLINTIENLSCYSGIMIFTSDIGVKYSVSSACSLSINDLVNKLINEMWQSYLFIYNNLDGVKNIGLDYYKINFLSYNNKETELLWGITNNYQKELNNIDPRLCKTYSFDDFYHSLKISGARFYSYEKMTKHGFYFTKILSPDFFLHMSSVNTSKIPIYCKAKFNLEKIRKIEIPFP
ncbi:YcaO-like family protein [Photorhabdus stackebrandtii]|uniref:YcaO domain-containing protein n=1 Tax=Photorhabdus stackebrandtii TaxID=1123042 RepID=A0A7X5TN69_9GAMM|nr:YcaO-like family protein [Photorhabdus stackebrandtii]NHB98553.1 hypothetical protein [Photorhabdus stackebrandtii]